jgi:hypothetical protein
MSGARQGQVDLGGLRSFFQGVSLQSAAVIPSNLSLTDMNGLQEVVYFAIVVIFSQ